MMSGYSEEHDGLLRLRKAHDVRFLQKPFTRHDLHLEIESLRQGGRLPLVSERHMASE